MTTEIIKIGELNDKAISDLKRAADVIKNGGLVVFPTETVYGLGADATNSEAAEKIYSAKSRPADNPLIIHISEPSEASKYTFTNSVYDELAKAFMPGPLTVVLPAKTIIPNETRAYLPTVAVRCPSNVIARTLIKFSGVPIAAPSANLSGSPSPTKASHVIDDMMGRVDAIIQGEDSLVGVESTVIDVTGDVPVILRPGGITPKMVEEVCGSVVIDKGVNGVEVSEKPRSPGMKYRHYAPKAKVILIYDNDFVVEIDDITKANDLIVYPNPATDYIVVEGNIGEEVRIYDLEGRVVIKECTMHNAQCIIDASVLTAGTYIVKSGSASCTVIIK
jgi:L-threonylcarbamoyladenylate synthase